MTKIQSAGVNHLDVVIANAGIAGRYSTVQTMKIDDLRQFFEVNTMGSLKLFQAAYSLLKATADKKGPGTTKFVGVTSNIGSIQDVDLIVQFKSPAYGTSKAALNFFVRFAYSENEWLSAFVINPGFAQTDMGNTAARDFGMDQVSVTIKDSTEGVAKFVSLSLPVSVQAYTARKRKY